ncbi:hypothetical protein HY570_01645 [Candidatus Micrarchaeota archaeon]|nr:hypothetical protein [Candidatus Micrarchaeota archaeon]
MFGEANIKAENNMIAAVSVFFGGFLIVPLIIYFMFKEKFVRFHSIQALLLVIVEFVVFFGGGIVTGVLTAILGPIALILSLGLLLLALLLLLVWLYLVYSAFTGKATKLPLIGNMAENWS